MAEINVESFQQSFCRVYQDSILNNCLYWTCSREVLKRIKYVYETAQDRAAEGNDLIILRKAKGDEIVVGEQRYKTTGDEPAASGIIT
jgi:hypothetical protein